LETMINRYVGDIEKMREQFKTQKSMFDDAFNNDPDYATQDQKVKEENRKKTEIKQRILKQPAVADLFSRLKNMRDEIKDTQDTLSQLLQQYYEQTGTTQITGDDGEIREIVFVRKLVKKNSKYNP
jgi:hypothetical protein